MSKSLSAINRVRAAFAVFVLAAGVACPASVAGASTLRISKETQECINCHSTYNPGLVQDWMRSLHSQVTPGEALKKRPLERRVSSENISESLQGVVVGCYECHSLNATNHTDSLQPDHVQEVVQKLLAEKPS